MRRFLPAVATILGALALAVVMLAADAFAANKTATLVPPSDYTAGGWKVVVEPEASIGATAANWCATTYFCAFDGATGARDCVSHRACSATPPADITTFVNTRLAAARAANGY